jgi:lysophospholipase L1-like esterase
LQVLFLGHSLIEYYDWQRRFPGHLVANLGVAGETTLELIHRVAAVAARYPRADVVFLMTGTNDLLLGAEDLAGLTGEAVRRLRRQYPEARLVLQGILPVDPSWVSPDRIRDFNERSAEVASAAGVEFLDLAGIFDDASGRMRDDVLLADGVHLSETGYRLWSKAVARCLEEPGKSAASG